MLLISTVAAHTRIFDRNLHIGASMASSNPNWNTPRANNVIFGGSVLLSPSSGEPTMANGYGPLKISSHNTPKPSAE